MIGLKNQKFSLSALLMPERSALSGASIVTRFAPSPTGLLHTGNYRTAVFAYLFARQNKGKFILRIEDTDKIRSKKEYEENIIESLGWLGLEYDEMYRQSERSIAHKQSLQKLLDQGKVYISKETPQKPGDRTEVIRFKNPNKKISFTDAIRGRIEFDTTELGDFVVAKDLDEPIFHFAVVADDIFSGVTHIIRGEDHISNTPRQILIYEALKAPIPTYAHLPLVLAQDKSKLSKRKGAKAITEYRDAGYLPEALINYMALIGWNPGTEQEIFSKNDLIRTFSLDRVQKSGAIFSEEKLRWVNKEHLKLLPAEGREREVAHWIFNSAQAKKNNWNREDGVLNRLVPTLIERIETYGDIQTMADAGEFDYYFAKPIYDSKMLLWKGKGELSATKTRLEKIISLLSKINDKKFTAADVKSAVWDYAEKEGRGEVLSPFRIALSGKEKSPDPFTLSEILGKDTTLARLKKAVEKCI
ncbi:MAG TPA: glutamate--tRNA ligase [Candidatus Paceibacterota bacterium]|nr:glutamate--tRNA ligase [Candidatus Paceibacterota bacterium]